ncbi:MAG: hypothetical protein HDT15_00245 [Oscillibacter sp.]|nr:hypothetical protein [Oscillibacter sp.]
MAFLDIILLHLALVDLPLFIEEINRVAFLCFIDKKDARIRKKSTVNPAERFTVESEEVPTIAPFSPQGGNGAVVGISELQ